VWIYNPFVLLTHPHRVINPPPTPPRRGARGRNHARPSQEGSQRKNLHPPLPGGEPEEESTPRPSREGGLGKALLYL